MKAALGEIIEPDDLGGAELHTRLSGVSDYMATSEREAYGKLREICATTNQRRVDARQPWVDWAEPELPAYEASELYGIVSADDRIRREVITGLMCNFQIDRQAIERAHDIDFARYFARELDELAAPDGPAADGIVEVDPRWIRVTETGRLFVRNVAMHFDAHLRRADGSRPTFSRTV